MNSLLIVGFPKGFTSQAWQIALQATRLVRPAVSSGEVLNHQRIQEIESGWLRDFLRKSGRINDGFYSRSEQHYPFVKEILDHFSQGNFCIKDVVQPFFVLRYLSENPSAYRVLFCDRPLEEVQERQGSAGWKFAKDMETVRNAYLRFPSFHVHDALYDGNIIFNCLEKLGYRVKRFDYFTDEFIRKRESLYENRRYRNL